MIRKLIKGNIINNREIYLMMTICNMLLNMYILIWGKYILEDRFTDTEDIHKINFEIIFKVILIDSFNYLVIFIGFIIITYKVYNLFLVKNSKTYEVLLKCGISKYMKTLFCFFEYFINDVFANGGIFLVFIAFTGFISMNTVISIYIFEFIKYIGVLIIGIKN